MSSPSNPIGPLSIDFAPLGTPVLPKPWWTDRVIGIVIDLNQRLGTLAFFVAIATLASVANHDGKWKIPGTLAFGMIWLFGIIGGLVWLWPIVPARHRRKGRGMVIYALLLLTCLWIIRVSPSLRARVAGYGVFAKSVFYHSS